MQMGEWCWEKEGSWKQSVLKALEQKILLFISLWSSSEKELMVAGMEVGTEEFCDV